MFDLSYTSSTVAVILLPCNAYEYSDSDFQ